LAEGERESVITMEASSKMDVMAARAGNMDFQSAKVRMRMLGNWASDVDEATGRRCMGRGKHGGTAGLAQCVEKGGGHTVLSAGSCYFDPEEWVSRGNGR
jgi:hypothetical protein